MPSGTLPRPEADTIAPPGSSHRIVVGIDGSASAGAALEWAARQAARTGAELEVLTTFGPDYVFVTPEEEQQATDEVLGGAAARIADIVPATAVTTHSRRGLADQVLVQASAGADLLVVGTRGLGGFRGLALGSVGRKCLHRSSVPLVVVRHDDDRPPASDAPGSDLSDGAGLSHRIVVGVDGSASSAAALEWAAHQASLTGALLEAVMTWEWPTVYGWSPATAEYSPEGDCETLLARALRPIRERYPDLAVQSVVAEGPAAALLVKESYGADLLAVGRRGHAEFTGLLLGSVSEHCVVHAHCPVLVHHPRV